MSERTGEQTGIHSMESTGVPPGLETGILSTRSEWEKTCLLFNSPGVMPFQGIEIRFPRQIGILSIVSLL